MTNLKDGNLVQANLKSAFLAFADLKEAGMQNANLQDADLSSADMSSALLDGANLTGAKLFETRLRDTDLYNVAWLEGTFWHNAKLSNTRIRRSQLGKAIGDEIAARSQGIEPFIIPEADRSLAIYTFKNAMEAYELLRRNFESIGRYADASWALVKEKQMEKALYFPCDDGQHWLNVRRGSSTPPPLKWRTGGGWLAWKARSAWYNLWLFLGLARLDQLYEKA